MAPENASSPVAYDALVSLLQNRFEKNPSRHAGLDWAAVRAQLEANPAACWSLSEMERTGGEPDVIGRNDQSGEYLFCDCSAESPTGRRSLCYDLDGLLSRKEARPEDSAVELAAAMGIELLTEAQYRRLQELGRFDQKTSSWLRTPPEIRRLGGALFGDRRYGQVFVYHSGAQSYYAVRGFRGICRV
jgi:hypothetical protein